MFNIRKPIDIISPADGKHYSSAAEYDRALDRAGQHVMSEVEFRMLREKLNDAIHQAPRERRAPDNHIEIDYRTGKTTTSRRDLND